MTQMVSHQNAPFMDDMIKLLLKADIGSDSRPHCAEKQYLANEPVSFYLEAHALDVSDAQLIFDLSLITTCPARSTRPSRPRT